MPNEMEGAMVETVETPELTEPEAVAQDAVEETPETQEVVDPEAGVDEPDEPSESMLDENEADVPEGKRSRDSAFAEMRRAREEAEQERDELRDQLEELQRAQREADIRQAGMDMGLTDEEIAQVLADAEAEDEREAERTRLTDENERLNQELMDIRIAQAMEQDLREIREIDPSVKSLDDLPDAFFEYKAAGLSGPRAYFAMKAEQGTTGYEAAPVMGKANQASVPRDYYTSEELDALTPEEIRANKDKVARSLERL